MAGLQLYYHSTPTQQQIIKVRSFVARKTEKLGLPCHVSVLSESEQLSELA